MKRYWLTALLILAFIPLTFVAAAPLAPRPPEPSATPAPQGPQVGLVSSAQTAFEQAVAEHREMILGYLVNEVVVRDTAVSSDGAWAVSWLIFMDPETGLPLPNEPGLALARRNTESWDVRLPSDIGWLEALQTVPTELVEPDVRNAWTEMYETEAQAVKYGPFGGYLLPWAAGETAYLSQSVLHDKYIPSLNAHYAFDFYIPGKMYNLYASKPGTVWLARWDVPNSDDSNAGNFIVLQDTTTNPVTYQLYLHLAQDSIPPALRVRGAQVLQGQFIGIADDTGVSTGHHLHFQVHTNPNSYWGASVDVTFDDVPINGGRPRVSNGYYSDLPYCRNDGTYQDVCNAFQNGYVSANLPRGDLKPPTGRITSPALGTTITNRTVRLAGSATDVGSGVASAQFMARLDSGWQAVGPSFTTADFSYEWDLCASGLADGPVSVALDIRDKEGNPAFGLPGLTHFTKQFSCAPPPPLCVPNADQVALFAGPNYTGSCLVLNTGDFPNSVAGVDIFDPMGSEEAESIMVGQNVLASVYTNVSYTGRGETLSANDSNLADNLIGINTAESIAVRNRATVPTAPKVLNAPEGSSFSEGASLTLGWRVPPGATEFQVDFNGSLSGWFRQPYYHLDSIYLKPGSYSWKVRARNCEASSCWTAFSPAGVFTITSGNTASGAQAVPFSDNMESGSGNWTASGHWKLLADPTRAHSGSNSWYYGEKTDRDYRDGSANTGDLTSPQFSIPTGSKNILRFWYRSQTEGSAQHWDQRWLQISKNGGPFINVLQLTHDARDTWLQPDIDLSPYAGSTIRIRFHFDTLDSNENDYEGWLIDDFEITSGSLPACGDNDGLPASASVLTYGQSANGSMCPSGDVDYFRFEGKAGDRVAVDITTPANSSQNHDMLLFLIDSDGSSVLAENDDEVNGVILDPKLGFTLTRDGAYYLKTRLWAHPAFGETNFTYTLRLERDNSYPTVQLTTPLSASYLNTNQIFLSANAQDTQTMVSRVDFYWHSGDWLNGAWTLAGMDRDGSNGWSAIFDTASLPDQKEFAFYSYAYDLAGNAAGSGAWSLTLDRMNPVTNLMPLAGVQNSTAVKLTWGGSDNLSGLDYFEIQAKPGSLGWMDLLPDPLAGVLQTWFIGTPGTSYSFRMRGVDKAGNREEYTSLGETATSIPASTQLCASADAWESDNTSGAASVMVVGGPMQTRNFCSKASSGPLNDEDWVKVSVANGKRYEVRVQPTAEMSAGWIEIYSADGSTLLASAKATGFGAPVKLIWTSDRTSSVLVRLRHIDGRVAGSSVSYQLVISENLPVFIPGITK